MHKRVPVTTAFGKMDVFGTEDTVTHYNVYSNARSELGRKLSNFAKSPFKHPVYGDFVSMEGFHYWLSTGMKSARLREVYGMEAKNLGRAHKKVEMDDDVFKQRCLEALHCKLRDNPEIYQLLMESDTKKPLTHYYVFGNMARNAPGFKFMLKELEAIRGGMTLLSDNDIVSRHEEPQTT